MDSNNKELISNYLDGELNADDTRTAELLISQDMEVRKLYEEIKAVDTLIDTLPVLTPTEEMQLEFRKKLAAQKLKTNKERKLQRIFLHSRRFAVAASILLMVTIAVFFTIKSINTSGSNEIPPKVVTDSEPTPPPAEIKIDEEMFEYMDMLNSVYDVDTLLQIDDSIIEGLEKNQELSLINAALNRSYQDSGNTGNE